MSYSLEMSNIMKMNFKNAKFINVKSVNKNI